MMLFGFYSQESSSKRYGQEAEEPELEPGPYSSKVRVLLSTLMPAINWSEPTSLMMLTCKKVLFTKLLWWLRTAAFSSEMGGVGNPGRLCLPKSLWLPVFLSSRVSQRRSLQNNHISQKTSSDLTNIAPRMGVWGCGECRWSLEEPPLQSNMNIPRPSEFTASQLMSPERALCSGSQTPPESEL